MRRIPSVRTALAVAVLCAAAALSLFAAALRARQPSADSGLGTEQKAGQELLERLDSAAEVDAGVADDARAVMDAAESSVRLSERAVADESAEVLAAYGERRDCVLRRAGYLGLLGGSWACLVYGSDWAEICVVTGTEDDGSEVRSWRITGAELEALAGE